MKLFGVFILLFVNSLTLAQDTERFKVGDTAFLQRKDPAKARLAYEEFKKHFEATPKDPEAAWRYSMACYFIGIRVEKDPQAKQKLYETGRDAALAGIEVNRECAPCHFWAAINRALYGNSVGIIKMLFSLNSIQDHLKRSIAADPKYAYGGAYRTLGLINQKVPGIFGGSNKRARENFEKAIEVAPDEALNYLFMVRLLIDEYEDPKTAMEYAQKAVKIPTPTPDRLECIDAIEELKYFVANGKLREGAGQPD